MALNFLNNGYFAGKVGIGTESPTAKLELGTNDFIMVNPGTGGRAGILFNETGTPSRQLNLSSRHLRRKAWSMM